MLMKYSRSATEQFVACLLTVCYTLMNCLLYASEPFCYMLINCYMKMTRTFIQSTNAMKCNDFHCKNKQKRQVHSRAPHVCMYIHDILA